jgi:dihydrofolate reductase
MTRMTLFIASSLDGFIARPDGSLDWLDAIPNPEGTDHGYGAFLSGVQALIMGRHTYEAILRFDAGWPYAGIPTYVASRNRSLALPTPVTRLLDEDVPGGIRRIRDAHTGDIWLVGGGELIRHCMAHDLVDRVMLTLVPVTLGSGIRLFPDQPASADWTFTDSAVFSTGLITLTYDRQRAHAPH